MAKTTTNKKTTAQAPVGQGQPLPTNLPSPPDFISVKLSNSLRDDIIDKAIDMFADNTGLRTMLASVKTEFKDISLELYNDMTKKYKEVLSKVPKEFLVMDDEIKVGIDASKIKGTWFSDYFLYATGSSLNRRYNDDGYTVTCLKLPHDVPVKGDGYNRPVMATYDTVPKQFLKYEPIINKIKELEKEGQQLRTMLRSLVNSVNTTHQLYAVWPESIAIIKDMGGPARKTIGTELAPCTADINKALFRK